MAVHRALAAGLATLLASATLSVLPVVARAEGADPVDDALRGLRTEAEGPVEVTREDGAVVAVTSADGTAVLDTSARTPAGAAAEVLADHGEVFGIDGNTSTVITTQTLPSVTGGTVVRGQQEVDGVPVWGGQVVTVLDQRRDVVSVDADTSRATPDLPAARVTEAQAERTALAATARARSAASGDLRATSRGLWVLDPAVVDVPGPPLVRLVWQVEVTGGAAVRQVVLVGADRGDVALQHDAAPRAAGRWVCDNAGARTQGESVEVPVCGDPALREGDDPGDDAAGAAYEHLGEAVATYRQVGGIDLAGLLGDRTGDRLVATTRWCNTDASCPYRNAFWDGRQVVLGQGYEQADDVVAHELTHGYVERTSNLFYFQQSGAINESLADTIGEVVDHQHGADDDSGWTVGEDLPGEPEGIRSMADPTRDGMPDRMTSGDWEVEDWSPDLGDAGGVHHNMGVGNRTAYLIGSRLDGSASRLAKTGTLYLAVVPRLTSGSQFADLGRVLVSTCRELQQDGILTAGDCAAVEASTEETQLSMPPRPAGASLGEVSTSCAAGPRRVVATDSDLARDFGWEFTSTSEFDVVVDGKVAKASLPMWEYVGDPGSTAPAYVRTGKSALFGYDPDPRGPDPGPGEEARPWTEPDVSLATSRPLVVPDTSAGSYFAFSHAFAFDQVTLPDETIVYPDGATVDVLQQRGASWVPAELPASAWANGPRQAVDGAGAGFIGFGGDSKGWGSSRVDLSAFAGQQVRVRLRIEADQREALLGWWLDDLELYSCGDTRAAAPAPAPPAQAVPTSTSVSAPGRVRRGKRFVVAATVAASTTGTRVGGQPVTLQRQPRGTRVWRTVAGGVTDGSGTARWTVSQRKVTAYRVVTGATGAALPSTSPARSVRLR